MQIRLLYVILGFGLFLLGCANRGTPSGGEKDLEPPVIVESEPENYATNFKGNEIRIYFNEYIKLKNISKQLIISPPMKNKPEITPLSGASKYINIKILDTLKPNTTYAFNFGNSIVDNNEENPFPYFRYVFSTGETVDSLQLKGNILDAVGLKPDTFVSVMLYEADSTYTDSLVYKELPRYITNTLDSVSTFTLENLKPGKYKLLALKDNNQDNKYQQRSDKIGFHEGFVTVPNDSVYDLKLFKETPEFKVIRPKLLSGEKIAFGYQGNPKGAKIEITSAVSDSFAYKITKDPKADSLIYWYKPRMKVDSLLFRVTNTDYEEDFTVRISEQKRDSLKLDTKPGSNINFHEMFSVTNLTPFDGFDQSKFTILDKDSLTVDYSVKFDTLNNRYDFDFNKTEENTYRIQMLPGAFVDFFETQNDTINLSLKTKTFGDYGNVRVMLQNAKFPLIVQLVDEKAVVKREVYATKQEPVDFLNVDGGNYYLRVVFDTNQNGIFDTGNFLKGIQPERVSYYPDLIEARSGWDEVREFTLLD